MPKRDKSREMGERLARIEGYLACPINAIILNDAIRQLGDGLNISNFDPSKPVGSLLLYRELSAMEGTYRRQASDLGKVWPEQSVGDRQQRAQLRSQSGLPERLERLYGQIVVAFKAYQGEKATIDELIRKAPVDPEIEMVIFDRSGFFYVYRTTETRMLDGQFKKGLADGNFQLHTTELMQVFVDLANEAGYFAGVQVKELKRFEEPGELEDHVKRGFIALKTCPEDEMPIAVPLKFA